MNVPYTTKCKGSFYISKDKVVLIYFIVENVVRPLAFDSVNVHKTM